MSQNNTSSIDISEKAESYFESVEGDVDEEKKSDLEDEIQSYEGRYEEIVEEHGEDHRLAEKANQILQSKREELQELEEVEERRESVREDLLRLVADEFELSDQWLEVEVVEAVTHTLYGDKDTSFSLFGEEVTFEALAELAEFEKIDREEVVIMLAKDFLGETDRVKEQYQKLTDSTAFTPFGALAEHGEMSSSDVADVLEEDKGDVNNWLKSPLHFWDNLIPFYRPSKGVYALSTTGRYFLEHYYEEEFEGSAEDKSMEEGEAEDEKDAGDEQTTLLNTSSSSETTEAKSEEQEEESDDVDLSEIEDTDEKAREMFSKVSENPDT